MKILMLYGPSHSGKTTTINMVYDALIAQNAIPKKPRPFPKAVNIQDYKGKDFEAVLECNAKGGTIKVALFSMGDIAYEVVHAMSFYEGMGCDVLVCACNDRFNVPTKRLQNRYKNVYPPIIKTVNRLGQINVNQQDVTRIIQMI